MYLNNKALLENREEKNKRAKSYSTDKPLSPPPPRSSQLTISRTVAYLKNIQIQPTRRAFSIALELIQLTSLKSNHPEPLASIWNLSNLLSKISIQPLAY